MNGATIKIRLDELLALWVMCWTFIPFMQVGSTYRIVTVVCAALWIVLAIVQDNAFISRYSAFIAMELTAVFLRLLYLYVLTGSFSSSITRSLQYIIVITVALMAFYYFDNDLDCLKRFFLIFLILFIVFSITTMQATFENPYASRIANSEWLTERFEGNENVGLYGFVYMCVFIEPLLLYVNLNRINFGKLTNMLCKIAFIILLVMILTSGYMIAIFLTVTGCLYVFSFYDRKSLKVVLLALLLVVFLIFYKNIIDVVFSYLMRITKDNPVYYNKFSDFRTLFLNGSTTGETVQGRFKNYTNSFTTILKYPILGSYLFGNAGGGGHSALLDVFGKFGVVTGFIFIYTYFVVPHRVGCGIVKWNMLDWLILFTTLIFTLSDPTFQEMGISLYVIFPLIKFVSMSQLNKREEL